MKPLLVRMVDTPEVPPGRAIMICDSEGNPLPNQLHTAIVNGLEERTIITVQFIVDGERIAIG
ncbi:hypothetical protein [Sphingobium yanoikuyae]|jgi:hypothetical protein|uniref:hypothetical protein n=1 Tax=Sphingobium yanoikuyae TaxID=13690 RepID=UPI000262C86B|nr:hypothetical protein [Sphingobium yanoikuyae]